MGKCFIKSRFRTVKGTPAKGILSGSSYILGLDSTPVNIRKGFDVAFFVNGDVRNDMMFVRPHEPANFSDLFFFHEQYNFNAPAGSRVRCLVHCNGEIWITEEVVLQTPHKKRKKSFPDLFDAVSLDTKSSLSSLEKVQELLRHFGFETIGISEPISETSSSGKNSSSKPTELSISGSNPISSGESSNLTGELPISSARCKRVCTKFFIANFVDTEHPGVSRIAAYHLEKFVKILKRIYSMNIGLRSDQLERLTQLGYLPDAHNASLYTYSYFMACTCEVCLHPSSMFLGGSRMISFAFPTSEEDPLYNEMENMWSYYDVFRHPFLNYGAVITLLPSISDPKYGYTIFSLSWEVTTKRTFKLQQENAFGFMVTNLEKDFCNVSSWYPKELTDEMKLSWILENPFEILASLKFKTYKAQ